ncbi:glycosyltransferase involved in cell wall biosynthesis [Caldicoprobacter guelmensis]|nr:glycosyltransferase involved in cell wall biosynthesis [Caldicoprobacter guelmensis]
MKSLVLELKKQGLDVEIWVIYKVEDLPYNDEKAREFQISYVKELVENDVSVKFVERRFRKDWPRIKEKLNTFYEEFKPDVVHSHLETVTFHVVRSLFRKVPIVETIHNTVINYPYLHKWYINRRLSASVAISRKVREIVLKQLGIPEEKVYLIYNGIPLEKFRTLDRVFRKNVKNIIAVGRLEEQKDYPTLIVAFKILKDRLESEGREVPTLNIVGGGSLDCYLKEFASELGLEKYINFLGKRSDIPDILRESDVYVMSSLYEGLSIALIEAIASGLPVVATNAGSNDEIIDNGMNGLIVPTRDSEALAEALYLLVINPDLRQNFSRAASKKAETFSIKYCAQGHCRMYEEILKNGKRQIEHT